MDFTAFVKELGIDKLPEEDQKAIFLQVFEILNKRVSLRMANSLNEEQHRHLQEIAEKDGNEAALEEAERLYPQYKDIYQEEIDRLKEDYKAVMPRD